MATKPMYRTLIAALLMFFGIVDMNHAQVSFHDVRDSYWAADEITVMTQEGMLSGYEDQTFRPQQSVTREEFAAMLFKSFNLEEITSSQLYTDVSPDRWSYKIIHATQHYLPGYAMTSDSPYFSPKAEATREVVAAALVRTLGYDQQDEADQEVLKRFRDASKIDPELSTAVAIATKRGLINGYEDDTFRPKDAVTRAEAAALLYRAVYGSYSMSEFNREDYQPDTRLLADFSQAVGWFGTVSQTTDPDQVIEGTSSVKLTTSEENTTTAARLQGLDLNLGQAKNMMIRLYIEDITSLSKFEIRLSADEKMKSYLTYSHSRWQLVQGWNEIVIPLESFAPVGEMSFEEIVHVLQVLITQRGEWPATVAFDALYLDYRPQQKGKVIIQFDDGWESEYSKAYPMMREKGFPGNVGIVSDYIGEKGYLTIDQLREMYENGWDLYNHTATHPRLTELTEEQAIQELRSAKAFLIRNRFTRAADFVAYPYGDYNDSVVDITRRYSRYARTITPDYEAGLPINPYRLKTIELVNGIDPSVYQEAIRTAAEHGLTIMFFLHKIEDSGTETIILHTDDFQSFLDFLDQSRELVDVISISEWYNLIEQ